MMYEAQPARGGGAGFKDHMTIVLIAVAAGILGVVSIVYLGTKRPVAGLMSERWVDPARNVKVFWVSKAGGEMGAIVYPYWDADKKETKDASNEKAQLIYGGKRLQFPPGTNVGVAASDGSVRYYTIIVAKGSNGSRAEGGAGRRSESVAEEILRNLAKEGVRPEWMNRDSTGAR
jgi:hypothetical protein